jgi:hypothetical protein
MNRLSLLLLISLLLVGCDAGIYSGTLIFEGEHQFPAGTQLPGDFFMRAGSAEFVAGSQISGTVYMIGGTLRLDGRVEGDVVVLDGRITLGPEADIAGDLRLGGGTLQQADSARVRGEIVTGAMVLPVEDLNAPTGEDNRLRTLSVALLLAILGGLWARKQPQPLTNVGRAAIQHWWVAGAVGLLLALVLPILLVIMAFTVILIPLVLILALVLLLLFGYGVVALGNQIGGWLVRLSGGRIGRGWATFGGTLFLFILFSLPSVGELLVGVATVLVLGALLLTRGGLRPYIPPAYLLVTDESASVDDYSRPARRHPPAGENIPADV